MSATNTTTPAGGDGGSGGPDAANLGRRSSLGSVSSLDVELGFLEPVDGVGPGSSSESVRPALELLDPAGWDGGKVGGFPVWFQVASSGAAGPCKSSLPALSDPSFGLICEHCSSPLSMVAQLYAPVEADALDAPPGSDTLNPSRAFHRSLYLFACVSGGSNCVNRGEKPSVVALRFQASEDAATTICSDQLSICAVCGLPASSKCSRCKQVVYCCKQHQALHWKGGHKDDCSPPAEGTGAVRVAAKREDDSEAENVYAPLPPLLQCALTRRAVLPEFELVVEPEPDSRTRAAKEAANLPPQFKEAALLALKKKVGDEGSGEASTEEAEGPSDLSDLTQRKLAEWTGSHLIQDKSMLYFARRVSCEPSQVVRYCRWPAPATLAPAVESDGNDHGDDDDDDDDDDDAQELPAAPLWVSDKHRPSSSPSAAAPCERCGAPRRFEFQVLPQLISRLASSKSLSSEASKALLSDFDFGTIAVYTCTASCGASGGYSREAVWVQRTDDEEESRQLRERALKALSQLAEEKEEEGDDDGSNEAGEGETK